VFVEEPGATGPYVHGLEHAVTTHRAEVVRAEDRCGGRYDSAAQDRDDSFHGIDPIRYG
jgi:hypothetical protein